MLTTRFIAHIKKEHLFSGEAFLLLAVSGGLDSVVMTELCRQAGFRFAIAHCNFRLRGEESNRDEQFVRTLAEKYGVPVYVRGFDTEEYTQQKKISIQEAARELRYEFFSSILSEKNESPQFLLTAHHQDDNIETALMNFLRGTGLQGLTGMPSINGKIRRPLLEFSREELLEFARKHNLEWVEDSSNQLSKYTRNYLRNEWIPAIEIIYPEIKASMARNIKRFKEINKQYQVSIEAWRKKLLHRKGEEWHVPVRLLMKTNKALIYELLSEFGFSEGQVEEIIKLSRSSSGKFIDAASGDNRLILHRRWFIIAPAKDRDQIGHYILDRESTELEFPEGKLLIESIQGSAMSDGMLIASMNENEIEFPLLLRKAATGDYFYPLGMKKKKKLSRFFIDNKLSKTEKERSWVLESAGRIIWVLGQRLDERVRLKPSTEKTLRISWIQTV